MNRSEFDSAMEPLAMGYVHKPNDRVLNNYYERFGTYSSKAFNGACKQAADECHTFPSKAKLLGYLPTIKAAEGPDGCDKCAGGYVVNPHGDWRYGPSSEASRCACRTGQALSATIPTTGKVYG